MEPTHVGCYEEIGRFLVTAAYPFGILMLGNALGHMGASIYRKHLMPGVYSSPWLFLASVWLLICAERMRRAGW